MTTIVYRDGVMAGDSQVTAYHTITGHQRKIHRVKGHLIGCCGRASEVKAFLDWFEKGWRKEDKPKNIDDFSAITVNENGDVHRWDENLIPYSKNEAYVVIGAGSDIAIGALAQGATAGEAVQAAIEHDVFTGGEVHTLKLKEKDDGQQVFTF